MSLHLGRRLLVVVALLWVTQPAAAVVHSSPDDSIPLVTEQGQTDESSPIDCYGDTADRPDNPGTMPPSDSNGRNTSYFRFMWSGDPDYPNLTTANRSNETELADIATCRRDRTYSEPPDTTRWNAIEHASYPAGDTDDWAAPSYVDPESGGNGYLSINDAYVAIFATTPSTIVHSWNGTTRYAAPNGTVRAIVDYQIPEPTDSEYGSTEVIRALNNHTTSTVLYVDGTAVDNTSAPRPELSYSDLSGTSELTVETTISANITEIRITEIKERDNGSVEIRENRTVTFQEYDTTVSSEPQTVTVQDLEGMSVEGGVGWYNESGGAGVNDSVMGLSVPGRWQALEFGNGLGVHSQWYFYTRGNESWATWDGTSGDSETTIRPREVHAVPVTAGPEITSHSVTLESGESSLIADLQVSYPVTQMASQPALPPEIRLNRASNSTTADWFRLRSSNSLEGVEEVTIHGLVRTHSATHSVDASDAETIHPANLTVTNASVNGTGVHLEIAVSDPTGSPVESGQVLVTAWNSTAERTLTPADDGTLTVTLSQSTFRSAEIRYTPAEPFWEQTRDVPIRSSEISYHHVGEIPELTAVIDWIVVTLLWFLPLVLVLYGIDMVTNGRLFKWSKQ
jgi:hypothetical protein